MLRITFLPLTEWRGKVGISVLKNNNSSSWNSSNSNSIKMKEIEDNMIKKKRNQLRMDNYTIEKVILMLECSFLESRRILVKNYVGLKFHKEKRKTLFDYFVLTNY